MNLSETASKTLGFSPVYDALFPWSEWKLEHGCVVKAMNVAVRASDDKGARVEVVQGLSRRYVIIECTSIGVANSTPQAGYNVI